MQTSLLAPLRRILLLFSIVILSIGVGLLFFAVRKSLQVTASKNWPSVEGKLLSCEVKSRRSSGASQGAGRRGGQSLSRTSYYLKLEYEYEVEGEVLQGNTITLGGESGGERVLQEQRAAEFTQADPLLVYHSPDNPRISVLRPGEAGAVYVLYIVGASFIAFAFVWAGFIFLVTKR